MICAWRHGLKGRIQWRRRRIRRMVYAVYQQNVMLPASIQWTEHHYTAYTRVWIREDHGSVSRYNIPSDFYFFRRTMVREKERERENEKTVCVGTCHDVFLITVITGGHVFWRYYKVTFPGRIITQNEYYSLYYIISWVLHIIIIIFYSLFYYNISRFPLRWIVDMIVRVNHTHSCLYRVRPHKNNTYYGVLGGVHGSILFLAEFKNFNFHTIKFRK